ncbi:MAG: hypothetical protein J6W05_12035 [Prevotella sp.]|nr:hypothetical protein [Prevotella sp.]
MRKFIWGLILVVGAISAYFAWGAKGVEESKVVEHDTIYKDTFLVALRDTVFYDAKWLRRKFETAGKAYWKNYGDGYEVVYPEFMNKVLLNQGERNLRVEYHGISMVASAYDDEFEMSVQEKYEGLNMSAVTKSVADSSFLLAGKCDKGRLFFEKGIKLKNRTWMYLRVEFPQELTWTVDPLLHYVKDYQP